jgi:hypothetical protein
MSPGDFRTRLLRPLFALGLSVALFSGALLSGCGSNEDNRPAQWSYIYPAIIQPSCATASCHSNFTRRAGVNFGDKEEAWIQMACRHFVVSCAPAGTNDACTGQPSTCTAGQTAVDQSQVLYQLRAMGASRMPPDFALPDADIQLISDWVFNGAQNN